MTRPHWMKACRDCQLMGDFYPCVPDCDKTRRCALSDVEFPISQPGEPDQPDGPEPRGTPTAWGPTRANRKGDSQRLPTPNTYEDIQSQVITDIEARREVGIERYGTALQPFNGRNALLDAYEEALDLAMYLKQRLVEEADHDL